MFSSKCLKYFDKKDKKIKTQLIISMLQDLYTYLNQKRNTRHANLTILIDTCQIYRLSTHK